MDMQNQAKGILGEFKAFLQKTNAIGAAIAIALGFATVQFVTSLVHIVITPILNLIKFTDNGFYIWKWDIAGLISAALTFVFTMWVIFVFAKIFIREEPKDAPKA